MYRLMRIHGHSMSPTLNGGELVVVDEGSHNTQPPQRGDLVAAAPGASGGTKLVKRIAGVPGEIVTVSEQRVTLGANEYLLLGDHAQDSLDSRAFGPVALNELQGHVRLRLWPFTIWQRTNTQGGCHT